MVLRTKKIAATRLLVNEARDGKEPTVAWLAPRGREAT